MPRAPTTPTSQTKGKDVASGSPSKQPRRKEPEQVQDRSQWRASWIHPGTTINKSRAERYYRLSDSDLKTLSCEDSSTVKKFSGTDWITPMYLYNEREIEMKAWEKHGGPEGFQRMLINRRAIWDKQCLKNPKKAKKVFPQPDSYRSANALSPLMVSLPENTTPFENITPDLVRMKQEMTDAGALWLWKILNAEYVRVSGAGDIMSGPRRTEAITRMRSTLLKYPRRPTSPPPETSAFGTLQEVLQGAPVNKGQDFGAWGLDIHENSGPYGWRTVDWNTFYQDEVYSALIQVIQAHGVEGWRRARWLVYDKYRECKIRNITFDGEYWEDSADFWLDTKAPRLLPGPDRPSQLREPYYLLLSKSRADSGY